MLIQSQHDDTVVNAERNVIVTASQGKITTAADQEIVWMTAGGAYIKLAGGNFEMVCARRLHDQGGEACLCGAGEFDAGVAHLSHTSVCRECLLKALASGSALASV